MKSTRPRLAFLDAATFGDVSLDRFHADWHCLIYKSSSPAEIPGRLRGCRAVVVNKVALDRSLLKMPEAQELRMIAVAATGTDNLDLRAAKGLGIGVCNVPGYATQAVAQFTMALILELACHVGRYDRLVHQGIWQKSPIFTRMDFPSMELHDKRLGIVGYGSIGKTVARIARGFGLKVVVSHRPGSTGPIAKGRLPLKDLLAVSDIVTLHCSLTQHTRNLINRRTLALMKPTALFINTARGGLVDEHDLVDSLQKKRLAGVALDVLKEEPPSKENLILKAAQELDNLIVTPHCAWTAVEARQRLIDEVATNLRIFLQGKSRNRVA